MLWIKIDLLQIGASVITNWDSLVITKWGRRSYKLGQLLKIRAIVITNWGSYYKLRQTLLQIRAAITNWSNYYKLGHNNCSCSVSDLYIGNILTIDTPVLARILHRTYVNEPLKSKPSVYSVVKVVWYLGHFLTQEMNLSRNFHQKSSRNCQHSHSGVINEIFISRNILEYGLEMCCFIAAF